MKKLISILLVAVLALALCGAALAAENPYTLKDGVVTGTYAAEGIVETYINDVLSGDADLNNPAKAGDVITVYVNGALADTFTLEEPAAPQESDKPADPQESDKPADPQESEKPADPQESEKPGDVTPVQPADNKAPAKTDSKGAGVPKTGEVDYTVALVVLALAGTAGMIVTGKKYGEN